MKIIRFICRKVYLFKNINEMQYLFSQCIGRDIVHYTIHLVSTHFTL